jgi:hypothetical protein
MNNLVDGTETTGFERKLRMVGTATESAHVTQSISTRDTIHNSENVKSTDTTKKMFLDQEFKNEAIVNFYAVPADVKR